MVAVGGPLLCGVLQSGSQLCAPRSSCGAAEAPRALVVGHHAPLYFI